MYRSRLSVQLRIRFQEDVSNNKFSFPIILFALIRGAKVPDPFAPNRKYERNGHLFQDRFRSEPVNSMEYFVTLIRYIHQNPVKAGLVDHVSEYPWSSWSEYVSHTDGFCATSAVLSRIPRGELAELVCSPVEEYGILDIDADTDKHVSDSEIRAFLLEKQGIANPLMVQSLEKGRRDEVLRSAKLFGAGIRQLSRLTGVSFGVIQKI